MSTPLDLITFGCRLNLYESEAMRTLAAGAGLSDVAIFNTCAVTAEAERQARQAIRRLRRERPDALIVVTGCAAQIAPEKYAEMPEVDFVIGNEAKMKAETWGALAEEVERKTEESGACPPASFRRKPESSGPFGLLEGCYDEDAKTGRIGHLDSGFRRNDAYQGEKSVFHTPIAAAHDAPSPIVSGFPGGLTRGFVQVQNGCDHRCTYCIIPLGRGPSRSVPLETIVEQTRVLLAQGYPEIVLTGVDITAYGSDLPERPTLGAMATRLLAQVPELKRLRLSSLDPMEIDESLWRLIADEPRLMPHLHLSLQTGDDMVLKRMKRRHAAQDVRALVQKARALRPGIAFGADLIAGFPTETDEMFANSCALLEELDMPWLHVFPYSARQGTPAAKMPQVPMQIRKERAARLREIGEKAAQRHIESLIGQTLEVHVEQPTLARTPSFAEVTLLQPEKVGDVVRVEGLRREGEKLVAQRVPL